MSLPHQWILILGVSSGFGAAIARKFASCGYNIAGVHLDRRSQMPRVHELRAELEATGRQVELFNLNAADDQKRQTVIEALSTTLEARGESLAVVVHSLAFGTLKPLVCPPGSSQRPVSRKQLEMTIDVMANSLVYWVQDLVTSSLLGSGARVFAMTSSGSRTTWEEYGPVSAAKAALESHVRQLCRELAPLDVTINAIMAGVTQTPALSKIPNATTLESRAKARNPNNRLTRPEDVAASIFELSRPGTHWMTGNTIRVDGGEDFCA